MKTGLRTIKTAIAVFLSCNLSELLFNNNMPFYSAVNTIICLQPTKESTYKEAINRVIGTFLGGSLGIIFITINLTQLPSYIFYLILSLFIVLLIKICVRLKFKDAVVITCVSFLSIAINQDNGINAIVFGTSRILETLLGVFVASIVNLYNPYNRPNKDILFVTDLDGTLLNRNKTIPKNSLKIINKQISNGLNFTIATARTPATLSKILENLNINLPVICMNGSVIYDFKNKNYIKYNKIKYNLYADVYNKLEEFPINKFIYTMKESHLYVYYNQLKNNSEKKFFEERKNLSLKTFVKIDDFYDFRDLEIIFIMILEKNEIINKIYNTLTNTSLNEYLSITKYNDVYFNGYSYLEIYSKNSSKRTGVEFLKKYSKTNYVVAFGDNENDISMFQIADKSFAMSNGTINAKNNATHITSSNEEEGVAKIIRNFSSYKY